MDFRLSEEQELLRRTVREVAETEIRPHVREWDREQHFPAELNTIYKQYAESYAQGQNIINLNLIVAFGK